MVRSESLAELVWSATNKTSEPMLSYDSTGRVYEYQPGERVILPKQVEAFEAIEQNEATLFGGAVGGGKSVWLRWALIKKLIQWAKEGHYDVRVGLFCETFKALTQRQINPSRRQFPSWLGTFNKSEFTFTLKPEFGGGMIEYCNLDDTKKYLSNEWAMAAFDEITRTTEEVYMDIVGRCRWPGIEHCPIIAATNPGGIGHQWVNRKFVNPKTRIQAEYHEDLKIWSKPYGFIQSLPRDNPLLPKSYWVKLKQLPTKRYNALVLGDWSVFEGQFFHIEEKVHIVTPFRIPSSWLKFRAIDHGWAHPTVCLWGAVDPATGFGYIYREHSFAGKTPTWHKKQIYEAGLKENNGFGYDEQYILTVGDPKMFATDGSVDRNKTPAEIYNLDDDGVGSFFMTEADNSRQPGWDALREMLDFSVEYIDVDGQRKTIVTKLPHVRFFNTCGNLVSSLQGLVHDEKNVEDAYKTKGNYGPGEGDDEAETLRYWVMTAMRGEFSPEYGEDPDQYNPMRLLLDREQDPMKGASIWAID